MNRQMIEDILQWEKEYLTMNKNLTDREKQILKGDAIKTDEGRWSLVGCMQIGKSKKDILNE